MTSIDTGRYAALLAHVAHFPRSRVGEVLRRLRVDTAAFDEAGERIPGEIANAAAAGDAEPAKAFRESFETEKARLRAEDPSVESLGPLDDEPSAPDPATVDEPPGVSPLASEAASEPEPGPSAPEPAKFVPSYLRDDTVKPAAANGPVLLSVGAVLPLASNPALAPTAPPPAPARVVAAALPHAPHVPHAPHAHTAPVHVVAPSAVRIEPAVEAAIEPSVESTLAPIPAAAAAKPLPFREAKVGTAPTVALQLPRDRASDPDVGDTIGIGGTIVPTAATPFEEAALERWTVEAYAHFVADRRIDPADQARAAYGLRNAAEEGALLVHMNKRFGREPAELARWQKLVAERMKARGRT